MTNTKHTPAPWVRHGKKLGIIKAKSFGENEAPTIATIDFDDCLTSEAEANARLIAAAPELLNSLIVWRDMYEQLPHEVKKAINLAFNHGNKAIAKAKGEVCA